jgi:hypothetical protein
MNQLVNELAEAKERFAIKKREYDERRVVEKKLFDEMPKEHTAYLVKYVTLKRDLRDVLNAEKLIDEEVHEFSNISLAVDFYNFANK